MTFDSHRATPGFGGIQIADKIGGNQAPVMATPAACDTRPVRSADGLLVAFRASHHRILDVVLTDIGGSSPVNRTYELIRIATPRPTRWR